MAAHGTVSIIGEEEDTQVGFACVYKFGSGSKDGPIHLSMAAWFTDQRTADIVMFVLGLTALSQ